MSDFGGEVPGDAGGCCEVGGDEKRFNATELGILKVGIGYLITDHYPNQDILRQRLEELSNKLDKMIDEANTTGR